MIILLMLPFLFGNFVQKWYFPQGVSGFGNTRIQIMDTDRDENVEFIFTTYGSWPAYIYFYEMHLPDVWEIDSVLLPGGDLLWDSGDFDGDGFYDLALQFHIENPSLADGIMIYESPDSFSYPAQEVWRDTVGQAAVAPISVYDIDQDGFPEIIDNNGSGQPHWIWVYESTGNNQYDTVCTFNPMTDTFPQSSRSTYAFGDFDSDGNIEFVMGDLSAGSFGADYWVFESPANNTYEQIFQGYVQTKNIKDCFSVPDADGDGKMEFVVKGFTPLDARTHAFIFEAIGDNTYEIIKSYNLAGGDYYGGYSEAGDVDGDSVPEIVLESASYVYIIKAAGNDSFYVWDTLPGHASGSDVRIFDIDGNGLSEIIISGNDETRIYEYDPGGIEEARNQIQEARYRLQVSPNPFKDKLNIRYQIPEKNRVNMKIYNAAGFLVKDFSLYSSGIGGQVSVKVWDGKDNSGQQVPSGVYFVQVRNRHTGATICEKVLKIE
ncbi:T9SS type A sorting domain-containing protein [candidate division WOR-3 bacterium]|nr:T9SS type A sorting domain-containing protein [candidate division WOR-3 bacterium]